MTPIISIVGRSGSGKTTYLERLTAELKSRGYRVASIKHAQEIHLDADKDSERHLASGSEAVVVATPERLIMMKKTSPGDSLREAARLLGDDYDLILAEGFKQGDAAKIVIAREGYELPLDNLTRVAAVVSEKPLPGSVRQFSLRDIAAMGDFLETGFIRPGEERLSIYVNGEPLPLIAFPRTMIAEMLKGMVASLKGVKKMHRLAIFMSSRSANDE